MSEGRDFKVSRKIQDQKSPKHKISNIPLPAKSYAPGKAIIVGEHAVVYGARAVAIPLNQVRMNIELQPDLVKKSDHSITVKIGEKELSSHGSGIVSDAMRLLNINPFPLTITGISSLPVGAGLGSSACLSVGVLKVLAKSVNIDLSLEELAKYANILEARFHGNPSGLDTAVVAYEECICFSKSELAKIVPLPRNSRSCHFALVDSNIRASTLPMIRIAAPYFKGKSGDKRIAKFDRLAELTMQALSKKDPYALADTMSDTASLLAKTGIVTKPLKEIINVCYDNGVLAAKTTGAGGGGVIMALLDPEHHEIQLQNLRNIFGKNRVLSVSI